MLRMSGVVGHLRARCLRLRTGRRNASARRLARVPASVSSLAFEPVTFGEAFGRFKGLRLTPGVGRVPEHDPGAKPTQPAGVIRGAAGDLKTLAKYR